MWCWTCACLKAEVEGLDSFVLESVVRREETIRALNGGGNVVLYTLLPPLHMLPSPCVLLMCC